jgi:hypothetical protein
MASRETSQSVRQTEADLAGLRSLKAARARVFVRNFEGDDLFEIFVVFAVAAVLAIRVALSLSGYPQIGGNGLHVAHLLWGGLLMLVALSLLLVYVGQRILRVCAVVGGIGFGVFVDELGKFVTSDNNYFYRPAIPMIYLIFLALFVVIRVLQRQRRWSDEVYLVNVLVLLQEAVLHDLDSAEHRRAMLLLKRATNTPETLRKPLEQFLGALEPVKRRRRSRLQVLLRAARRRVRAGLASRWMTVVVSAVFSARAVAFVLTSVALLAGFMSTRSLPQPTELVAGAAALVANLLGLIGVLTVFRSRPSGLVWFKRSVMISILVADVFAFYQQQLAAVLSLTVDVVLYVVVNALLRQERRHLIETDPMAGPVAVT